jgi:hypothetical protein
MKKKLLSKRRKEELLSNKREVNRIISRVYKELNSKETIIIFKNLRGCHGEYNYLEDEISIDLRKEILPTIVHELLHKWHPDKTEKWVMNQEKYIMKYITIKQSIQIISLLLYKS